MPEFVIVHQSKTFSIVCHSILLTSCKVSENSTLLIQRNDQAQYKNSRWYSAWSTPIHCVTNIAQPPIPGFGFVRLDLRDLLPVDLWSYSKYEYKYTKFLKTKAEKYNEISLRISFIWFYHHESHLHMKIEYDNI